MSSTNRSTLATSVDLGIANAEAVMRALLGEGALPRALIAERTGLTRGTITRVTTKLVELGLLRERDPIRTTIGRPMVPLEIAEDAWFAATIHFGAAEMRYGVVDLRGRLVAERPEAYEDPSPQSALAQAARGIRDLVATEIDPSRVFGLGVAVNGIVDTENGSVVGFPSLSWSDVAIVDRLSALCDWPVELEQTVRGLAIADGLFGVARWCDDYLQVWVGSVLSAAIVSEGRIRRGPQGAAGIINHLRLDSESPMQCACGRRDCLWAFASDAAILARGVGIGAVPVGASMQLLTRLADGGDEGLRGITDHVADRLAEALLPIVDVVNPERIVLAGLVTEVRGFGDTFARRLDEGRAALGVRAPAVLTSRFGDDAVSIAAAAAVLDRFYRNPFVRGAGRTLHNSSPQL